MACFCSDRISLFVGQVIYMIYKCIREQRRLRRHRLPKSMLKKLPVLRYTKNNANNKYDTCVICLEDFIEDDKLRVLPCSHREKLYLLISNSWQFVEVSLQIAFISNYIKSNDILEDIYVIEIL